MVRISKRRKADTQKVPAAPLTPQEAVKTLKGFSKTKFDQTVEICMHLGIDPRHADQQLRGAVSFPKGVGRSARVICFCPVDKVDLATAAGAIEAGATDLTKRVSEGWMDFDVAISTPDMMREVGKLGRVLGPKGLMPSPKAGTVTADYETAVKEYAAGKIEYRNDDSGNIHCIIGKLSFSDEDLVENLEFFLDLIERIRPASAKGIYVKNCTISGTMTPGVQIAV